jgi:hypothetical protein
LVLTNVLDADAGGYSVIVTNAYGGVTSAIASLTVLDLLLTGQPATRTNSAGTMVTFNVTALGSPPPSYRWLKDGVVLGDGGNVAGAGTSTLTLNNVLAGDAGDYSANVSNASGSVTSAVAALVVVDPVLISQPIAKGLHAYYPPIARTICLRGSVATHYSSSLGRANCAKSIVTLEGVVKRLWDVG